MQEISGVVDGGPDVVGTAKKLCLDRRTSTGLRDGVVTVVGASQEPVKLWAVACRTRWLLGVAGDELGLHPRPLQHQEQGLAGRALARPTPRQSHWSEPAERLGASRGDGQEAGNVTGTAAGTCC